MQVNLGAKAVKAALTSGLTRLFRNGLLTIFLGMAMLCAATFAPGAGRAQSYSFNAVTVEGNARVDAATIISYAGIERGKVITAAALNDAYQRIIGSGLFETVEMVPQGSTLLVRVTEFPTVNIVDFQGNKRVKDDDLSTVVKSKSRLVYSPAQAEADAAAMTELYRVKGRMAASITPKIIRLPDNRVDLVFEIAEGAVAEIQRLNFVGNHAFSDYRLRQILQTKQAGILHNLIQRDTFIADRLELDKQLLKDFYLSRGYLDFEILDASATYARERDATFLTFTIREGQSFKIGKVTTISEVDGVDAAAFDSVRRLRTGVTYSPNIIDNNVAAMENLALKQGLNFIRVDPRISRNDRDGTLDVTFAITRGEKVFVERIDIEGNTTTLDSVVRRQFRTVEGDPFNPREIRQSAERIRALGYFADVEVNSSGGTGADQVVVKVDVEEQPTGSLSFGATYGVSAGFGVNVGFAETNFLGRGQTLRLNVQNGSDTINSSVQFIEPAFLGRDLEFSFSGRYARSSHSSANYDTRTASVSPAIEFPVSSFGRLGLNYKISQDAILNVDDPVADDPATVDVDESNTGSSDILQEEEGTLLTSSLGYSYDYDNRASGLHPKGGILLRFSQDFAGIGGDTKYIETNFLALAETKVLSDDVTLRGIIEGGIIQSYGGYDSRVTERFFGNGKIRGFSPNGIGPRDLGADSQDALGGNIYAVAHLESDFPLGLPEEYGINGGAFIDVGSVWGLDNTAGTAGEVDDSMHLRSVIGFSVYWKTPLGPLRLNFTHALMKEVYDDEQTFDLTIATRF